MKRVDGRTPLGAGEGAILTNTLARDWGDVLDGVAFFTLFYGWSSERRRGEDLRRAYFAATGRRP